MSEENLFDAISTAIHELERNNFSKFNTVGYVHPYTLKEAAETHNFDIDFLGPTSIHGIDFHKDPDLAENLVVVAHLEAARHGAKAIQTVSIEPSD